MSRVEPGGWRLGADVGGTFTDLVLLSPDGRATTRKVLSTTANYADAILQGVRELLASAGIAAGEIAELIHGTTVATNAILERRGARTGLVTTEGFRDLLEIGRIRLSRLYDMDQQRPVPLVRRRWRFEVEERLDHKGNILRPLDPRSIDRVIDAMLAEDLESLAVCLVHAYANPVHERAVAAAVRARLPGLHLSLSSEVLPEIREFERTSTTVTNAYVMPVIGQYLSALETRLDSLGMTAPILIMQSNGGVMSARRARQRPVQIIESGPAAGVIAAAALARRVGAPNVISVDMGGTTAKASVIEDYEIKRSNEFEIGGPISQGSRLNKGGGYLLRTPAIDIAEVGAGGGSLVTVDDAGALHVGPQSAGAVPGPVCYDLGGAVATLTDANVALGYLAQDRLPSGLVLAAEKGRRAIEEQIARPLRLSIDEAAHGVYLVGCAGIARAVRAVTIERGRDPRDFTIIAFGGNGPLLAAEMARSLEIGSVLVPLAPGVFSALGLLEADVEHHLVRTFNRPLDRVADGDLARELAALANQARDLTLTEGHRQQLATTSAVDARYAGQSFELTVPVPDLDAGGLAAAIAEDFGREHERTYGHRAPGDPIQIVNLRVIARVPQGTGRQAIRPATEPTAGQAQRLAYFGARLGQLSTPVIGRFDLAKSARPGPLLIDEYDATTLVPPDCTARLDALGNIIIAVET
ncbi:hydantoinase/oxoprolinase family protein [Reyranella sp.]|jgi:N-methylhydantoinase A|uniref:hydantoinase/oxoprolinase family protein n=1 Tax=Reyranella sp. TaxID=1929291 RepID=UPI002F926B20